MCEGKAEELKNRWIVLVIMFVICSVRSFNAFAQQDTTQQDAGNIIFSDARGVLHDAGKIFGAPLHFSEPQWLVAGSILVGTAVLFTVDESGRSLAKRNHSHLGDAVFGFGREYGREVYGLSASIGLYAGGLIFKDESVRETGVMLFESIAFAGAITSVLKSVIGRSRPYVEEGNAKFRGFQFKTETTSLPSGHTTVAFAVSSVLAGRIKNTFASIGLYSVATLTAVSRVYHDAHWVSDNFLAAAIGTCVGLALVDLHDTENRAVSILLMPSGLGMRAEVMF
jgi:membrane-associated phospholipid phosphatase